MLLDRLALWQAFAGTAGLAFLAIEAGFALVKKRPPASVGEASVSSMSFATVGLLSFMLAFVFYAAEARYSNRKALSVREANAIGTTYLRAEFLAEPSRTQVRRLLREYVDLRIKAVEGRPEDLSSALARSVELQDRLWAEARVAGRRNVGSLTTALFVQSLNETIDLHLERVIAGLYNRVPPPLWAVLFLLLFVTMFLLGYQAGLSGSRSVVVSLALVVSFSAVLLLNVDLDRPQEGRLRVRPVALLELQKTMHEEER